MIQHIIAAPKFIIAKRERIVIYGVISGESLDVKPIEKKVIMNRIIGIHKGSGFL